MSSEIQKCLVGITYINDSLKDDNKNIQQVEKATANLQYFLNGLERGLHDSFTPLTEPLKNETLMVLEDLQVTLGSIKLGAEISKIQDVKAKLLHLRAATEEVAVVKEKGVEPLEIQGLSFFCDIDVPDANGSFMARIKDAVSESKVPFIVTRSIFKQSNINDGVAEKFLDNENYFLGVQNKWEIYQKGEMLVFIPASFLPNEEGNVKLAALDLKVDGSLQKISMREALQGPQKKAVFEEFLDLFVQSPKKNKIFHIGGHGNLRNTAGLNSKNFKRFLDFLENQRCKGLLVTACASGGKTSLDHLPDEMLQNSFLDQEKPHSFSTFVQSVGEFTTRLQEAERGEGAFFEAFIALVNSTQGQTISNFRHMVELLEKDKPEKQLSNQLKFYPAHSPGSPMGFRPLNERGKGYSLTFAGIKRRQVNHESQMLINGKDHLEVHPLVTPLSLKFEGKNPSLLSMTPGPGQHVLYSINLAEANPLSYLQKHINLYKSMALPITGSFKAFFIRELIGKDATFEGVVLHNYFPCLWKEGKRYFSTTDGITIKEISGFSYESQCFEIARETTPYLKSVRAMSGGQESISDFTKAVRESPFFDGHLQSLFDIENFPQLQENFLEVAEKLSPNDKEALVLFLVKNGLTEQALAIFDKEKMKGDLKDFSGNSLLSLAIEAESLEFVKILLSKGAKPDERNSKGLTPLMIIIQKLNLLYTDSITNEIKSLTDCEQILNLLLNSPIDLNAVTENRTAIDLALPHHLLVKKLIEKGASGSKALCNMVRLQSMENIDTLLALGVNPNIGKPSPIYQAMKTNDIEIVKKLIKAGAEVFKKDESELVPFIEAVLRSSTDIIKYLIDIGNCDFSVVDKQGISPFLASLISGNKEKIHLLFSAQAPLLEPSVFFVSLLSKRFVEFINEEGVTSEVNSKIGLLIFDVLLNYYFKFTYYWKNNMITGYIAWLMEQGAKAHSLLIENQRKILEQSSKCDSAILSKIVDMLLPLDANPSTIAQVQSEKVKGEVMMWAWQKNDRTLLKSLINEGVFFPPIKELRYSDADRTVDNITNNLDGEMVEILHDGDVDLNKSFEIINKEDMFESEKTSFLQLALKAKPYPNKEAIRALLEYGVNPRQKIDNMTALHFVVQLGDKELVKMLLEKGAKADLKTIDMQTKKTPLELAESLGHQDIVKILTESTV